MVRVTERPPHDLDAEEALLHVGVRVEEGPRLVVGPLPAADLGRSLEPAVHPDVEHHPSRAQRLPYDKDLYKARSDIECTFNLLK